MGRFQINKDMLPMKGHFFLFNAGKDAFFLNLINYYFFHRQLIYENNKKGFNVSNADLFLKSIIINGWTHNWDSY